MKIKKEKDGTFSITGVTLGKLLAMQTMFTVAEKATGNQLSAVQSDVRDIINNAVKEGNKKSASDFGISLTNKSAGGTSLQAYIFTSYSKIVDLLGEPNAGNDGYKTDVEWHVEINGKVFTIYNYKDGKNYNGESGLDVEEITEWHIGAKDKSVNEISTLTEALAGRVKMF